MKKNQATETAITPNAVAIRKVCVASSGLSGADIPGIQPTRSETTGSFRWRWVSIQIWILITSLLDVGSNTAWAFTKNMMANEVSKPTSAVPQPDHGGVRL